MLLPLLLLAALAARVAGDEHNHRYTPGEEVVVWFSTVGPFANRQETYEFFKLPYCTGEKQIEHAHESLGEALQGIELVHAGIDVKFRENAENKKLCTKQLSGDDVASFRYAITSQYWYQAYVDNLPIWGFVGDRISAEESVVFTHREFSISYNNDRIIEVNLTNSKPFKLETPKDGEQLSVDFTFSVKWVPTTDSFDERFEKYLDSDFFEHRIHWFSIVNSFMMVLFLVGLVAIILLRTLKNDYARYEKEDFMDLNHELGDEYGWKQVHGDVFRSPVHLSILSSLLGTGMQLIVLALVTILYTIIGDLYIERATILTASIFIYALTSFISGYVSLNHYTRYGGRKWIRTLAITSLLFPGTVALVAASINFIAIYYTSAKAIPFGTMVAVVAIWLFLIFPLNLLGAIVGKNYGVNAGLPCRVNPIPRPIPDKVWYAEPLVIVLLGGVLPFGSIFIEMYFIFASFFAYKIYYVYGFMLLVFCILLIVTACVSIVSTYFLLNSEDHRWHWISFVASGSTAVYVFLYAVYYFYARTRMYGMLQTSWYFGYTGVACFGLFAMLGCVGYASAERFVKRIYSGVKVD